MTPIEQAARAMEPYFWATQDRAREIAPNMWASERETTARNESLERARACIAAYLRASLEPSDAMIKAGNPYNETTLGGLMAHSGERNIIDAMTVHTFRAMRLAEAKDVEG